MVAALATLWLWRTQERSRASERWQSAQQQVAAAEQAFAGINEAFEHHAVRSWLIRAMDQLVRTPDASVDFLMSRCGPWEYRPEVLATAIAQVSVYVRNAQAEIVDASRNKPLTTDWDDFRIACGIPVTSALQAMVYERVYLTLLAEQRTNSVLPVAHRRPFSTAAVGAEQFDENSGSVARSGTGRQSERDTAEAETEAEADEAAADEAEDERPAPRHGLVVTSAERQRLEVERARIVEQMFQAATAAESARVHLDQATRGWSTKWYLLVTGYATVVGIVLPGIALTVGPTALNARLRWLLFAALCTVVVAVVSTFAITIRVRGQAMISARRVTRSGQRRADRDADPARAGADGAAGQADGSTAGPHRYR